MVRDSLGLAARPAVSLKLDIDRILEEKFSGLEAKSSGLEAKFGGLRFTLNILLVLVGLLVALGLLEPVPKLFGS